MTANAAAKPEAATAAPAKKPAAPSAKPGDPDERDRSMVEQAIEQALEGVRVELEAVADAEMEAAAKAADDQAEPKTVSSAGAPESDPSAGKTPSAKTAAPRPDPKGTATAEDEVIMAGAPPPMDAIAPPTETSGQDPAGNAPQGEGKPLGQILARMTPPASLEDISRAVDASGGRTMDEIVEGIMRPIIRDWLADNLPGMAERIVREEIERVSRRRDGS